MAYPLVNTKIYQGYGPFPRGMHMEAGLYAYRDAYKLKMAQKIA